MLLYEPWMDYVVIGPEGWEGVREDAPQWAKDDWEKYKESIEPIEDGAFIAM